VNKLLGLVIAVMCAGCFAQRQVRVVEAPDPTVGDLRCQAPHLSVSEALYYVPGPVRCE
jgi:hypothetical protein